MNLVDEGRFAQAANQDLLDMQAELLGFVEEHGKDAKGAKAKLTIEITLVVESPSDDMYSIKAQTKTTLPARPASVSMAVSDETQDGLPCIAVRPSGSDKSSPRQGKICTDAGEKIDVDTGEVVDAKK